MSLALLREDRFRGNLSKLPMCQMLLSKGKLKDTGFESGTPILFVKGESVKLSGWVDNGSGIPYTHVYDNGTADSGIAFSEPRLHFLASSPRLVEVTGKGFENGIGRKGEILGNYETAEGSFIREAKYPKEYTTLRTLHMVYLVGEKNQLLHKVPLILSIHGGGAAILGTQLDLFYRELEVVYSEHENAELIANGQDEQFFTLNEAARAIAVFSPLLDSVSVGSEQKSIIPAFANYIPPTVANLEQIFNFDNRSKIWATQNSLSNFASRYLKQFEVYHPVADESKLMLQSKSSDQLVVEQIDFEQEFATTANAKKSDDDKIPF